MAKMAKRASKLKAGKASAGGTSAPPLPAAIPCNCTALRRATRRVSQLYDAVIAASGLRSTQRSMMAQVARAKAPTMGELAAALVLDRSALAHNLKPLERDGLIAIGVDPQDQRSRLVTLTKRGEARLRESESLWRAAQTSFETAYGAKRADKLRRSLLLISSPEFVETFWQAGRD
jgi:DNA-binding MarR family transcriptional regulator